MTIEAMSKRARPEVYLPTPAQIAEECRKIREEWRGDDRQQQRRYGAPDLDTQER